MREDWPRVTRRTTLSHACFKYAAAERRTRSPVFGSFRGISKRTTTAVQRGKRDRRFFVSPSSVCERRYALHQHDRIFVVAGGGRLVGTLDADKVGKFLQRRRAARGDQAHRGLAAEENTGVV